MKEDGIEHGTKIEAGVKNSKNQRIQFRKDWTKPYHTCRNYELEQKCIIPVNFF